MSRKKTIVLVLYLLCVGSFSAQAQTNITEFFADCVGRLSAETEHAWLMGDPSADQLSHQRQTLVSLLEAATPRADARRTLTYRIEAKMAHASLLTLATFHKDPHKSKRARQVADDYIATCRSILLTN